MRITYLHQYFNTPDMAGGTRSYEMARRLVAAGHEVNMITTWRDPTERRGWFSTSEAGINVHWLPVPYSNHMGFAKRLRAFQKFAAAASRKAATLPADVIFATSTPLTIAIPGIIASRVRRIPLVFEVRDLWPDVPVALGVLKNPVAVASAYALERLAYRSAAAIVVVAPGMKPAIMTRGIAPERIEVIPNGCDFSVFDNAAAAVDLAHGGGTTILYLGTMGVANGVEYIPRLASEIGKAHPDVSVRFVLIGDGGRRAAAETIAKQLGVWGSTVTFVDPVPKREVARWLAAADATIITYDGPEIVYRDSVSNKFFDSIAAGKPVLANYSGYATVTAAEAGAGFIIDKDPAVAAGQVSRLVADPGALLEAGNKARQLARERFDRDMLAEKLEVLLRDVVRRASSPGSA